MSAKSEPKGLSNLPHPTPGYVNTKRKVCVDSIATEAVLGLYLSQLLVVRDVSLAHDRQGAFCPFSHVYGQRSLGRVLWVHLGY